MVTTARWYSIQPPAYPTHAMLIMPADAYVSVCCHAMPQMQSQAKPGQAMPQ
jgi:hypothetical protein